MGKILDYIAPQMQNPQMPTLSPAVMSGQLSPDQAQASGINVLPNAQPFSPVDRWLPLINALGGALSTPGSPTQPLAPLGGAIQGFGQGRLEQIQLERQAAAPYQQVALDMYVRQREAALTKQVNQQKATDLRTQAMELDEQDPRRASLLTEAALLEANVPEAARFLIPRQLPPEQARAYTATADLREKQATQGPTASTPAERAGRAQQGNFNKAVSHVTGAYNGDPSVRGNLAAPSRAEWYKTENGQRAIAEGAAMAGISEYEFRTKIKAPNATLTDAQIQAIRDAPDDDTFNLPGDTKVYTKAEMLKLLGLDK